MIMMKIIVHVLQVIMFLILTLVSASEVVASILTSTGSQVTSVSTSSLNLVILHIVVTTYLSVLHSELLGFALTQVKET